MTNILKKVLSIRRLSEAASAPNLEDEDIIVDSEMESTITETGLEPIPNFASQGITDHTEILLELIHGPSLSIYVGVEEKLYTIPLRLLSHHTTVFARGTFLKNGPEEIFLPTVHPHAFAHIYRWMHQDKLGILTQCTHTAAPTALQDACTLLSRIFFAARYLSIRTLQDLALKELKTAFAQARGGGNMTPVLPSLVLEVWEDCAAGAEEGESLLWKMVLEEMCIAFSQKPMPAFAEYDACWKRIDAFRMAVGGAMADRIKMGESGRDAKRVKLEVMDEDGGDELYE